MLKIADFAKSSVDSESIHNEYDMVENDAGEGNEVPLQDEEMPLVPKEEPIECRKPKQENHGEEEYTYEDRKSHYDQFDRKINREIKFSSNVGLPQGFSVGNVGVQRKGDKKTFYCDMCLVELSSMDTLKSHVSGVKHMKKLREMEKVRDEKLMYGLITEEEAQKFTDVVRPIPNPESVKKKIPIRLHEKIKTTKDPVIGLQFVDELLTESDAEMEPHYNCTLCGNQGSSNGMFSHLMGAKHRQKVVEETSQKNASLMSKNDLLKYAMKHSQNEKLLSAIIKTTFSDLLYPWPPMKAPWAIERGGSGIPPPGARSAKDSAAPDIELLASEDLPGLNEITPPSNDEEAARMLDFGQQLLSMMLQFEGSGLSKTESQTIEHMMENICSKAKCRLNGSK